MDKISVKCKAKSVKLRVKSLKFRRLEGILSKMGPVAVAFSGGTDSAFLLKVASEVLGADNVLAVTAASEIHPRRELKEARKLAERMGVRHVTIRTEELKDADFKSNPPERCYYCKRGLFDKIRKAAEGKGITRIADATNYDDVREWRPGMRAAEENGVISPLKAARMTKNEIRAISKELGLPTWDKPAFACLATRIPYAEAITRRKLSRIESAEKVLRDEFKFGQVRLRCHADLARIEVAPEEAKRFFKGRVREGVAAKLKKEGFKYVTLDLEGYRGGSAARRQRG